MDGYMEDNARLRQGEVKTTLILILRRLLRLMLVLYERFLPKTHKKLSSFDKILIINLYGIGDFLMATPAIRAIRNRFPASRLAVLTGKETAEIADGNPYIDQVISYSNGFLSVVKSLIEGRFDLVISLNNSAKAHLLACLSTAKYRCGYLSSWLIGGNFRLFKENLFSSPEVHFVDSYLKVA